MNRFERPLGKKEWDADLDVKQAKAALVRLIARGGVPGKDDFPNHWKNISGRFQAAQRLVCGYCGARISGNVLELDHFRPKGAVARSINEPGREIVQKAPLPADEDNHERVLNVRGRSVLPHPRGFKPGYWWLAYDWNNFVAACNRCNAAWKRTLFPVANPPDRAPKPTDNETPLLLNPFDVADPSEHYQFDEKGGIRGKTDQGVATIETCGLRRQSLTTARYHYSRSWPYLLQAVKNPQLPQADRDDAVYRVREACSWDQPFAAMFRGLADARGVGAEIYAPANTPRSPRTS